MILLTSENAKPARPRILYLRSGSCCNRSAQTQVSVAAIISEIEVIQHSLRITCLRLCTPDLLFDLLETGFDFPTRPVVLDHLFNGEGEIGCHQRHIAALSERSRPRAPFASSFSASRFANRGEHPTACHREKNRDRLCQFSVGSGTLIDTAKPVAVKVVICLGAHIHSSNFLA